MATPTMNTAMPSLTAGPGAKPFAARHPMVAPTLPLLRRPAPVVRAQNKDNWNNNLSNKLGTNLQDKSGNFKDKSGTDRFQNVFKFWGPAPERINGRLAMVGFVSALVVEAYRGDGLLSQVKSDTGMAWFVGTAALFTVASLVPLFRGVSPEDRSDRNGIWTEDAEIWNGRAAMVGLVALACTEFLKGAPFINV